MKEGLQSFSHKTVVEGIVRPRLEEIFEHVMKTLDAQDCIHYIPSGLVLTGGGALTTGALDSAKRVIGLPARIGTPQYVTGLIDEVTYPQFAAVVGLLLYAKDLDVSDRQMKGKDFDKIFRNISMKGSVKKFRDLFKSFIP